MEWTYQKETLSGIDPNTGEEVEFEHVKNPPMLMGLVYELSLIHIFPNRSRESVLPDFLP